MAWSKLGEFCSNYFRKGQQVGIIGRIETRQYDDKDGKRVYVTEVIAEEAYFADSKKEEAGTPFLESTTSFPAVTDDDLPFKKRH